MTSSSTSRISSRKRPSSIAPWASFSRVWGRWSVQGIFGGFRGSVLKTATEKASVCQLIHSSHRCSGLPSGVDAVAFYLVDSTDHCRVHPGPVHEERPLQRCQLVPRTEICHCWGLASRCHLWNGVCCPILRFDTYEFSCYYNVVVGWCLYYIYYACSTPSLPSNETQSIAIFNDFTNVRCLLYQYCHLLLFFNSNLWMA